MARSAHTYRRNFWQVGKRSDDAIAVSNGPSPVVSVSRTTSCMAKPFPPPAILVIKYPANPSFLCKLCYLCRTAFAAVLSVSILPMSALSDEKRRHLTVKVTFKKGLRVMKTPFLTTAFLVVADPAEADSFCDTVRRYVEYPMVLCRDDPSGGVAVFDKGGDDGFGSSLSPVPMMTYIGAVRVEIGSMTNHKRLAIAPSK
jgi:hypothetical protein